MKAITAIRKPLLLVPILAILGLSAAWAQPGQGRQAIRAQIGTGQILDRPEVKEKLGLTDEQVSTIQSNLEESKRAQIELDAQMKLLQLDLQKAMDADEIDEKAVGDITRKIGELHGKQLENRLKNRIAVRNTLTDEQMEKAREGIREKAQEWREKAQARRSGNQADRGVWQRGQRDGQRGPAPAFRGQQDGQRGQRGPAVNPRGNRGPQSGVNRGFAPQGPALRQGLGGGAGVGQPFCPLGDDAPGLQRRGPGAGFGPGALPDVPVEPVAPPDLDETM